MKINRGIILLFILALLIPIIDKAYTYCSDVSVDLFLFADAKQAFSYYIYDSSKSVTVILMAFYIRMNSISFYIRKTALVIAVYFMLDLIFYWLFRESVSTVGIHFPYFPYEFGFFHFYVLDTIAYFIYYIIIKKNKN